MASHSKVLFVGAGPSQMPAIQHARTLGYIPYAVDADPLAVGFQHTDGFEVGDIRDSEFIIACAQRFNVNAIVAVATDVPVPAVARACASCGFSSISVEAAEVSVNKLLQRQRMKDAGISVPAFMPFQFSDDAARHAAEIGFPVVIKPSDSAGSRGVRFVRSAEEVMQAATEALDASRSKVGLVEEYIEGLEVSVEGFVVNGKFSGICISEKSRTKPPYLLDMSVHFPDFLSTEEQTAILAVAGKALSACGLNNCPVHMELLRSERGPIVVELAARGAGFRVFTDILPHVTGIDTVGTQLQLALGEPVEIIPLPQLRGAVIIFISPVAGKLKQVKGLDQARLVAGVQDAEVYVKPGTVMSELRCGADRAGHLIVFGENRQEAECWAELALSFIKLEME